MSIIRTSTERFINHCEKVLAEMWTDDDRRALFQGTAASLIIVGLALVVVSALLFHGDTHSLSLRNFVIISGSVTLGVWIVFALASFWASVAAKRQQLETTQEMRKIADDSCGNLQRNQTN